MFKIVLSKPTFDAFDTDPDNLIFSSDYDTLKYETVVDAQMTVNNASYYDSDDAFPFGTIYYHRNVVEITHGLGYIPFFIVYQLEIPSAGRAIQLPLFFGDFLNFLAIGAYADATKIYILRQDGVLDGNTGSFTQDFVVRIFKNEINI